MALFIQTIFHNLNAMHEAEATLTLEQQAIYRDYLAEIGGNDHFSCWINPSAHHRAEAFLRTIGKWIE